MDRREMFGLLGAVGAGLPLAAGPAAADHGAKKDAAGLMAAGMTPEDELKFMKMIMPTWGKAWHTWPDPKSPVPMGEPLLIWSLMGDGQADEKVVAARDKEFGCTTAAIREKRCKELGLKVPNVSAPKSMDFVGRQWTDDGDDKPTKRR